MRVRRTQQERSAATKKALLDATVDCLFRFGYSATTTILVAEKAGVSRGAMLHQFASKADLMAYVVEAIWETDVDLYAELLNGIEDSHERLIAYPEAVWKVLGRPSGIAVMEIYIGSRSDPALAEKLAPVQARISENTRAALEREFHHVPSVPLLQLIVAAIRGLSMHEVFDPEGGDGSKAVKLLQDLLKSGLATGILK